MAGRRIKVKFTRRRISRKTSGRAKRITRKSARRPKRPKLRAGIKVPKKLVGKVRKPKASKPKEKIYVGKISHYFTRLGVGVVEVEKPIRRGDWVKIEGFTTNFRQKANSIQFNRKDIKLARRGMSIGLKVNDRVRENDKVYVYR